MKGDLTIVIDPENINVSIAIKENTRNEGLIKELQEENWKELRKVVKDNFLDYYDSGLIPEKGDQLMIEIGLLGGESGIKLKEKKSLLTIVGEVDIVWWSRKGNEPKPRFTFTIFQVF